MSKHTPAPWNIAPRVAPYIATSDDPQIRDWMQSTGADRFNALSVGTAKGSVAIIPLDESNEANAKLIAAAPELLSALHNLLERYTGLVNSGDAGFWDCEKEEEVIAARDAIAKATK